MIGAIENAMIERMVAASAAGAIRYAFRTKMTLPHNFDEVLSSEMTGYPAIWAVFDGVHKAESMGRGSWHLHGGFSLVVAAENARNEQSRRHGGSESEPGSYQMAMDAVRILSSQSLGLGIDSLEPVSIVPVDTSDIPSKKLLSLYAVSFDTGWTEDVMPDVRGDDLAPFVTLHANWDPAPYGHVDADPETDGVQIPDDTHAVGTDHLTLQEPE